MGESEKSEVFSIRINPELKKKLQKESGAKDTNLNSLINSILIDHISCEINYADLGVAMMFRSVFKDVFDAVDKEKIIKISETTGKAELIKLQNYVYGSLDIETLLIETERYLQKMNVKFNKFKEVQGTRYFVQHDLGKNWPYYLVHTVGPVLEEVGYRMTDKKFEEGLFSFTVEKS